MTDDLMFSSAGAATNTMLQLRVHDEPDAAVVAVRGEVDLLTAGRLAAVLAEQADGHAPVVVADLSTVDFFGAAGLEALSVAQRQAAVAGVSFRLVAGPPVSRLLSLADPPWQVMVYDNVAEAIG